MWGAPSRCFYTSSLRAKRSSASALCWLLRPNATNQQIPALVNTKSQLPRKAFRIFGLEVCREGADQAATLLDRFPTDCSKNRVCVFLGDAQIRNCAIGVYVESDNDPIDLDFGHGLLDLNIPTRSNGKVELMLVPIESGSLGGKGYVLAQSGASRYSTSIAKDVRGWGKRGGGVGRIGRGKNGGRFWGLLGGFSLRGS